MKWKCKRCEAIFDDSNKKCDCVDSPSPWIPYIEIQFEKIEVKSGPRKLDGKWTIELDPEIIHIYWAEETKWEKCCHWIKYLFVKGKKEKL